MSELNAFEGRQELEQWIAVATEGLAPESGDQVYREIAAHYQSAVEDSIAAGMSDTAARRDAILALGDPSVANREYAQALLTGNELKYLQRFAIRSDKDGRQMHRLLLIMVLLIAIIPVGVISWMFPREISMQASQVLVLGMILFAAVALMFGWGLKGRPKTRLALTIAAVLLLQAWLMFTSWQNRGEFSWSPARVMSVGSLLLWMLVVIKGERINAALRRKLPRERWPWQLSR